MVLTRMSRWAALAACGLLPCQCVWVDEEAPDGAMTHPADYAPRRTVPDTLPSAPGIRAATTGEIAAFLGTRDFRIALIVSSKAMGSSSLYILEPGADTATPFLLVPPQGGSYTGRDWTLRTVDCSISPDGDALVFARAPRGSEDYLPRTLWMLGLDEPGWLVPLAASGNRSLGMIGKHPFWYRSQGKSRIAFAGLGLSPERNKLMIEEMREVGKSSDSSVSPVEPMGIGGAPVREILRGLSRDGRWALLRKEDFPEGWVDRQDYLVPVDRLADTAFLASRDSLLPYSAGPDASLNPFDASESGHTDYYLTLPFRVFGGADYREPDTLLAPRTVEGKPGFDPARPGAIWICDKDRKIVLSHELPDSDGGSADWVQWTNHPNFILAGRGGSVYIVKLAPDPRALLDNPETATLRASGVLRLLSSLAAGDYLAAGASLWVGATP